MAQGERDRRHHAHGKDQRGDARYESASQQVKIDPRDRIRVVKMAAVRNDESNAVDDNASQEPRP